MKITLLLVGKTTERYFIEAIAEYEKRLKHYIPFNIEVIDELRQVKNLSTEQIKEREGELITKRLAPGDWVVLLDENGTTFTSTRFADYIEKRTHTVAKRMVVVVGGAYGFSQAVYALAHEKISLSPMTFSHQMVRLIFVEQLYRAMTILNNEPYHHQ